MNFYRLLFTLLSTLLWSLASAQMKQVSDYQIPTKYVHYQWVAQSQEVPLDNLLTTQMSAQQTTKVLQQYINQNKIVVLPNRPLRVGQEGITLKEGSILKFQSNSALIMEGNSLEHYGVINIIEVSNVKVMNARITGDRYAHKGNKGEWGHGIRILGANNVIISNFFIDNNWGDGIYIGRQGKNISSNIVLENGMVVNNRRNGISVTSIKGLKMENITAAYSNGVDPQYGIDLEPNDDRDELDKIVMNNIYTYKNNNGGLMITFNKMAVKGKRPVSKNVNISVSNYIDHGSKDVGLYVAQITKDFKNISGGITFNNVELRENKRPIVLKRVDDQSYKIKLHGFNIVNPANKNAHNKEFLRVTNGRANVDIKLKNQ